LNPSILKTGHLPVTLSQLGPPSLPRTPARSALPRKRVRSLALKRSLARFALAPLLGGKRASRRHRGLCRRKVGGVPYEPSLIGSRVTSRPAIRRCRGATRQRMTRCKWQWTRSSARAGNWRSSGCRLPSCGQRSRSLRAAAPLRPPRTRKGRPMRRPFCWEAWANPRSRPSGDQLEAAGRLRLAIAEGLPGLQGDLALLPAVATGIGEFGLAALDVVQAVFQHFTLD